MWNRKGEYTRVKLCWFETLDASYEASTIGADALGFHIFSYDSDWQEKARRFESFFRFLPQGPERTLLTDLDLEALARIFTQARFDSLQLYPDWDEAKISALRGLPGAPAKIIKVMSAKPGENFTADNTEFVRRYAGCVDAILLDSCREGGSGQTSDWDAARRIVERSPVPVFLAGGLTPENVADAVRHVRPFGVDVESGVSVVLDASELPYLKNMKKCRAFVQAVAKVDREIQRELARASPSMGRSGENDEVSND